MVKNVMIFLEEDLFRGCNYQVFINGEMQKCKSNGISKHYQKSVEVTNVEIVISHEDEWGSKDKISNILSWLISFDLQFGSVYERLPLYANYSQNILLRNDKKDLKIYVKSSEILRVEKSSMTKWKKATLLQMILILVTLILISSFIIKLFTHGWVMIILFLLEAIGGFILWKCLTKRKEKTIYLLEKLSSKQKRHTD